MAYFGIVTQLTNLHKDPNSNSLYLAECCGDGVIVTDTFDEEMLVVYLPTDGKVHRWFGDKMTLFRKNLDGTVQGGYLEDNGHVKAIRLRGNRSSGIVLKLSSIYEVFGNQGWQLYDKVDSINGKVFVEKYIPPMREYHGQGKTSTRGKKAAKVVFPDFEMHKDTEQLIYNYDRFHEGDKIQLTLKMHGTSQRSGMFEGIYPLSWWRKLLHIKPKRKMQVVCGTRRTVVNLDNLQSGFYGNDEFRLRMHNKIAPFLEPGMEVFYEIVGYYANDERAFIMPPGDNRKLNDKAFVKEFGTTTFFTYGCDIGECEAYIYRITSEYGAKEWEPQEIQDWCRQHNLCVVPEIECFEFTSVGDLNNRIDKYFEDLHDPVGKDHIKEGVVIRIYSKPVWEAYKQKTFAFRCIESLIKDTAEKPDMEEAQEIETA